MQKIDVYIEIGEKKTFAGAMDWPGWTRSGKEEGQALQALLDSGPRYALVAEAAGVGFQAPAQTTGFNVVERLKGDATTDFGAPGIAPSGDSRPVGEDDLGRFQALLEASWQAFDAVVKDAAGKELRKGPRGGGRELESIIQHILGSDEGYLSMLAWKVEKTKQGDLKEDLRRSRAAVLAALAAAARGKVAEKGPRGGKRWTARYFVRRIAWHVLDHAWEIEDRIR